ncbi:MAG: sugar ABC transporter substrate-binding protein [Deinococcota bacterium]
MKKQVLIYTFAFVMVLGLGSSSFAQTTIKWFMRWDQARVDNVATPVMEAFTADTGINVEYENIGSSTDYYTKLQTTIAGGSAPDVFYPATHVAYSLASKGAMLSLNDLIEQDNIDMSQYDPTILDLYTIDGEVYCLPIDSAALVVFYNTDMFDAAGVPYPEAGWTWDDFLATAQTLTIDQDGDGRNDQFGVDTFRNYWPMVVWSNTGQGLFDDIRNPTTFIGNSDEAIASIQWVADLINVHNVMPSDEDRADITDLFAAGKSAMQVVGHWRVPRYLNAEGVNFDFAPLPIGASGQAVNRADGSCFAISSSTDHPEEAWELVKYLAAPEAAGVNLLLDLQLMTPALSEFRSDPRFLDPEALPGSNKAAFLAGTEGLQTMYDPIHPMYSAFDSLWKQELGEVWIGAATAEEAVARIEREVNDILANIEDFE